MSFDPVVGVVATSTVVVLVTFLLLDSTSGSFEQRATRKATGGLVFAAAVGLSAVLAGLDARSAGLLLVDPVIGLAGAGACLVGMGGVAAYSSTRPGSWAHVPELRAHTYDRVRLAKLVGAWTVYLLGYEALFRGVLLFVLVDALGELRGVAVMTAIYALAHLTKRPGEAFGTLVVGPIYGWIALRSGGFWPVFLAHLGTALLAELVAIHANPSIDLRSGS